MVNNDGGGIFSMLPQAALAESFERVFGTPHGVDLGHLAAAADVPYTLLEDIDELPRAIKGDGLRMVEVRTDRHHNAEVHAAMREAAHAAMRK